MLQLAITDRVRNTSRWLNRQLWQTSSPGPFFDPLTERVHPLWVGRPRAQVIRIRAQTPDTRTVTLRPNRHWRGFEAGQHANMTADIQGVRQTRTFSLCSSPLEYQRDGLIRFTVKRIEGGTFTPWLHQSLKPGQTVDLGQAFGDFLLPADARPLFYLAGGSGITPVLSHLQHLADTGDTRPIALVYLVRDQKHLIAAQQLKELQKSLPGLSTNIIYTRQRSGDTRLTLEDLRQVSSGLAERECFLCGPAGLLELARPLLTKLKANPEQTHEALFKTATATVKADVTGSLVRNSTGEELVGDGKSTLLEIAEQAGLNPIYGCRQGVCRQCACTKTSGLVINRLTGSLSGPGEETIQPCISLPQGPVTVEL